MQCFQHSHSMSHRLPSQDHAVSAPTPGLLKLSAAALRAPQGFQRVSDNIGGDAPSTRERFEAIVTACAKTASLDSSFQESEIAVANGHSSTCPKAKVGLQHSCHRIASLSRTQL